MHRPSLKSLNLPLTICTGVMLWCCTESETRTSGATHNVPITLIPIYFALWKATPPGRLWALIAHRWCAVGEERCCQRGIYRTYVESLQQNCSEQRKPSIAFPLWLRIIAVERWRGCANMETKPSAEVSSLKDSGFSNQGGFSSYWLLTPIWKGLLFVLEDTVSQILLEKPLLRIFLLRALLSDSDASAGWKEFIPNDVTIAAMVLVVGSDNLLALSVPLVQVRLLTVVHSQVLQTFISR